MMAYKEFTSEYVKNSDELPEAILKATYTAYLQGCIDGWKDCEAVKETNGRCYFLRAQENQKESEKPKEKKSKSKGGKNEKN